MAANSSRLTPAEWAAVEGDLLAAQRDLSDYLETGASIGITGSVHFLTGKLVGWKEPPWAVAK